MGLGQSSKAPVTDDTDEGECPHGRPLICFVLLL